jgi:hypothetical protein
MAWRLGDLPILRGVKLINDIEDFKKKKLLNPWPRGDAGYRSPYLSHAKRALYHLSYIPPITVMNRPSRGDEALEFGTADRDI